MDFIVITTQISIKSSQFMVSTCWQHSSGWPAVGSQIDRSDNCQHPKTLDKGIRNLLEISVKSAKQLSLLFKLYAFASDLQLNYLEAQKLLFWADQKLITL